MAWGANMDIQYVGEDSQILNGYITSYITKGEKNSLAEVWTGVAKSDSLRQNLMFYARHMLRTREVGEYEAIDTLAGNPFYYCSDQLVWVSTAPKESRKRRLKNYHDIKNMHDDEKIYFDNMLDDYYPNRCKEMENYCLHDVCSKYEFKKGVVENIERKIENGWFAVGEFGWFRPCKRKIVKTFFYNISTTEGIESYYRALLMLFKPWRDESELIGNFASYEESFNNNCELLPDMIEFDKKYKRLHKSKKRGNELFDEIEKEVEKELLVTKAVEIIDSNIDSHIVKEVDIDDFELEYVCDNVLNENELSKKLEDLNEGQRNIFDKIINSILPNEMNEYKSKQIQLVVSGVAGTGKSFLIDVLASKIRHYFDDNDAVAILGPTGVTAFNVRGSTIHSFFRLSVQKGKECPLFTLSGDDLKKFRCLFKKLKLIIIDEFSMVSNTTLVKMDNRILTALGTDDCEECSFSGISIVMFGDLLQLAPVNSEYIFQNISALAAKHALCAPVPVSNIFSEFIYAELEINMRQKEDLSFAEMLNRIRIGSPTIEDINQLRTRFINYEKMGTIGNVTIEEAVNYFVNLLEMDCKAIALLPKNDQVDNFNNLVVKEKNMEVLPITATDRIPCRKNVSKKVQIKIDKMKYSDTGGLQYIIHLGIGARVMLRRNLNVKLGLVNGSLGTVKRFVFDQGSSSNVAEVVVDFDGQLLETCIEPVKVEFAIGGNVFVERKQFPLCLAYAITVHKCQGLTLSNILLDLGTSCFGDSMAYVALSRARCLSNIHLMDLDPYRLQCTTIAVKEYNRLRCSIGLNTIDNYNILPNCFAVNNIVSDKVGDCLVKNKVVITKRIERYFLKLLNNDTKCYCNSLIQCLLAIRDTILRFTELFNGMSQEVSNFLSQELFLLSQNDELAKHGDVNLLNKIFSTTDIIKEVWGEEKVGQQDVHEFWNLLAMLLPKSYLKLFEFSLFRKSQCNSLICKGKVVESDVPNQNCYIVSLGDIGNHDIKFKELFELSDLVQGICSQCGKNELMKFSYSIAWKMEQKYVIIMLPLNNPATGLKWKRKITHFDSNKCIIFGKRLKLIAAVQHINSDNIHSGHYVAWVRQEKVWYVISDSDKPNLRLKFVNNLDNMYMLFFVIL